MLSLVERVRIQSLSRLALTWSTAWNFPLYWNTRTWSFRSPGTSMLASSGVSGLESPFALGIQNALQLGVILEHSLSRLRSGNADVRPTRCHGSPRDRWKKGIMLFLRTLCPGLGYRGSFPPQLNSSSLASCFL